MRTIAIINYKGGVAKTTTAVNLGAALARKGFRTLIVDLDAQASATAHLGFAVGKNARSIYDAVLDMGELPAISCSENLWLVPSDVRLSLVDRELAADRERGLRVGCLLDAVRDSYDYVFLDCPPNFVLGNMSALLAADYVMIPSVPTAMCIDGIDSTFGFVARVKTHNPSLKVLGVLFTKVDSSFSDHAACLRWAEETYGDLVLRTKIRRSVALAKAAGQRTDIYRYPHRNNGASDYDALAEEVMSIIKSIEDHES